MTITKIDFDDRAAGPYTATAAQTVFSYDFPVYAEGDLTVTRERDDTVTTLVLNTDYTVTGVANEAGGTIVLAEGATEGDIIAIDGSLLKARATSFSGGAPFKSGNIDSDLNRLAIMVQELAREVSRAPRRLATDPASGALSLPFGVAEDTLLALDATGKLIGRIPKDFFVGIEGAGVGSSEESVTDGHVPIYDGASGLLLRSAGFAPRSASEAIPLADIADISTARLLGRSSVGAGSVEQLTAAQARTLIGGTAQFQCYMSLDTNAPVLTGDAVSQTAVYLHPFHGNMALASNGSSIYPRQFTKQTLTLVSAHVANTIYDCFAWDDNGTLRFVTGPAWFNSAAGGGSRGSGAGTTELTLLDGVYVNAVSMTGRNGATTWTVPALSAVYVGSIYMDGTNGELTCHRTFGQSRKWGVWNAWNRRPIILKMGDSTGSWTYSSTTIRQSNGASGNTAAIFSGLAEELFHINTSQSVTLANNGSAGFSGIGVNSTTAYSGRRGAASAGASTGIGQSVELAAKHVVAPSLGIQNINFLESTNGSGTQTFYGSSIDIQLTAQWMG